MQPSSWIPPSSYVFVLSLRKWPFGQDNVGNMSVSPSPLSVSYQLYHSLFWALMQTRPSRKRAIQIILFLVGDPNDGLKSSPAKIDSVLINWNLKIRIILKTYCRVYLQYRKKSNQFIMSSKTKELTLFCFFPSSLLLASLSFLPHSSDFWYLCKYRYWCYYLHAIMDY